MSIWKATLYSLLYFIIAEVLAGLVGIAVYFYHQSRGSEACSTLTLLVLCQGLSVWTATLTQKSYFRKILQRRDSQLEGDCRLILMDKILGSYIAGLTVLFVICDYWLNISQRLPYSLWIFLVVNIIIAIAFCGRKVKCVDDERQVIKFSEWPFVVQRLFLGASPWLAALAFSQLL